MDITAEEIIRNYKNFNEDGRLKSPFGIIEELHTKELITRHLSPEPMDIYDVGAGTGVSSSWLAGLGHQVHFSDIVPKHVEIFKERFGTSPNVVSINIEDARRLSYENGVADLIILNGPLYHLTERKDRIQCLKEAWRILKQHGKLLGFTISRFAGLNYAMSSGEIFNDDYFKMVTQEINSGVRDNRDLRNKTFSSAYFHHLEEIEAEFADAGFVVENSFGVGLAWNLPGLEETSFDEMKKQRLLEVTAITEKFPMQCSKILTIAIKE